MKGINLTTIVILILAAFFIPGKIFAANYYVDAAHQSANGNNPGTEELPLATIKQGVSAAHAGDTVYIKNGTYNEQLITIRSGNATAGYITFAAYPGHRPKVDGTGSGGGGLGSNGICIDHDYIKILGLEAQNWVHDAIWVTNAAYTEISDCIIHDSNGGIKFSHGSHDFVLNRNTMYNYNTFGFDASPDGSASCYNGTINDCVAHHGKPGNNVDGFALGHGQQSNFVFNRCTTYNVYDGFDISSKNTTLNRCVAYNCAFGGYKIWQDNVKLINCIGYDNDHVNVEVFNDQGPITVTLQNCTFKGGQRDNISVVNSQNTLRMFNCILVGGNNKGLTHDFNGSNLVSDYNIIHCDNAPRTMVINGEDISMTQIQNGYWTQISGQDAHSIVVASPQSLFENYGKSKFQLTSTNAAIDAGTSVDAPAVDYEGNSRPNGQGYDIGAYEYHKSQQTRPSAPTGLRLTGLPASTADRRIRSIKN